MHKAKSIFAAFVFLIMGLSFSAHADSPTAGNVFSMLKGTTTIDKGGAIESQARSIYSLGGGITSFKGKKVSLIAADPPSFSAGCNGISWHFGGFAFISMDEIRQMVEAVAQASLGVAVDLAMQTLCPQCYAIMSKLRDVANAMRNAAADSCKIAENMGTLLKSQFPGVFNPGSSSEQCGSKASATNEEGSTLGSRLSGGVCAGLDSVMNFMNTKGQDVINYLNGTATSDGKTPDKATLDQFGNTTYSALTSLGYKDGFVKDVLLSYLGMRIIFPKKDTNCSAAFKDLEGTAWSKRPTSLIYTEDGETISAAAYTLATERKAQLTGTNPDTPVKVTGGEMKSSKPDGTGTQAVVGSVCDAPPLLASTKELAMMIMCGTDPTADYKRLQANFKQAKLDNSSFSAMCGVKIADDSGPVDTLTAEAKNMMIYRCGKDSSDCMVPKMMKLGDALSANSSATSPYTGLGWMIMDALYSGVSAVMKNEPLPPDTIAVLNGSGYPLYRLLNLAAVYPGMTDELLSAYSATIAAQYAANTLTKLIQPGENPAISYIPSNGVSMDALIQFRTDIRNMTEVNGDIADKSLKHLYEKRALVDAIVQVNKALQAEVISQGLGGNADLAVSLKKQITNQ